MFVSSSSTNELFTAEQVRELDRIAIEELGVPGIVLMKRAGRALFDFIKSQNARAVTVFCGTGNNGGDGFIMAGLAAQAGLAVRVMLIGSSEKISGDALLAKSFAEERGINVEPWNAEFASEAVHNKLDKYGSEWIVDALLGTGLCGDVRPEFAAAIQSINDSAMPVLAADIPSGLCSDTGKILGIAVEASATISFIGRKRGLYTGQAANVCGQLEFSDLAVPEAVKSLQRKSLPVYINSPIAMPARTAAEHKGSNGHVLIIGGNQGMVGAIAMASLAALRTGAGLVSCATVSGADGMRMHLTYWRKMLEEPFPSESSPRIQVRPRAY